MSSLCLSSCKNTNEQTIVKVVIRYGLKPYCVKWFPLMSPCYIWMYVVVKMMEYVENVANSYECEFPVDRS